MKPKISSRGFTLTEILIVVVILGILAGIAIPRFFPQAEKSRIAEALGILSAIRQGEESYLLEQGEYCDPNNNCAGGWGGLGMDNPDPAAGDDFFDYTVAVANGGATFTATATRTTNSARGIYNGNTITINQDGDYGGTHPFAPN